MIVVAKTSRSARSGTMVTAIATSIALWVGLTAPAVAGLPGGQLHEERFDF